MLSKQALSDQTSNSHWFTNSGRATYADWVRDYWNESGTIETIEDSIF